MARFQVSVLTKMMLSVFSQLKSVEVRDSHVWYCVSRDSMSTYLPFLTITEVTEVTAVTK